MLITPEEKELLIIDLSSRLFWGVKFLRESWNFEWDQETSVIEVLEDIDKDGYINNTKIYTVEDIKPYLRPMSSMTEEEKKELSERYVWKINGSWIEIKYHSDGYWDNDIYCPTEEYLWLFNWLNKHHFDYRGLIEKSLVIAVTEENNPYKK